MHLGTIGTLLLQIIVVLVTSRLLGLVMRRLGQPLVMAEVLAGIILGPSLFGWLAPDTMATIFPAASLGPLGLLSQVGLVLFMFLVGAELDPQVLRERTSAMILISHTSIVIPFGLGAGAAFFLYDSLAPPGIPFLAFTLFLGVSMSVTAFPVLARILTELDMLTSKVGSIAIACAAVDDVTAWCLLAVVVGIVRAGVVGDSLITIALTLGFVLFMLRGLRPVLHRLLSRIERPEDVTPNVTAGVLLLLFVSSMVTELIGVHALFGAFLAGAILPKQGALAKALVAKIETVAVVVLLPLFFAFSGLRTQIGLVSSLHDWLLTLTFIGLASIGKFGGSTIAARLTGMSWREASTIGVLMNTRGLMELVVLNIGYDLGVISPRVFTMLVIMALVTTFATAPIVARLHPRTT